MSITDHTTPHADKALGDGDLEVVEQLEVDKQNVGQRTGGDTGAKARLLMLTPPLAALLYPFALQGFNASLTRISEGGYEKGDNTKKGTGYFFMTGGRSIGGPSGVAVRLGIIRTRLRSRMRKLGTSRSPDAEISAGADMSARVLRHCSPHPTKASLLARSNQQTFQQLSRLLPD